MEFQVETKMLNKFRTERDRQQISTDLEYKLGWRNRTVTLFRPDTLPVTKTTFGRNLENHKKLKNSRTVADVRVQHKYTADHRRSSY
jgi:hypothetical protein